MSQRRKDELQLSNNLLMIQIDKNLFSDEDIKLMQNGGYSLSDSEIMQQSNLSIEGIESKQGSYNQMSNIDLYNLKTVYFDLISVHSQKQKYTSLISMAEKDNAFLQQEIKRIIATSDAEKQRYNRMIQDFEIQKNNLIKEIQEGRARELNYQNQVPLIKDAMVQIRDMLNGLIPETTYLKLRDLPEKDLIPSEWVLINVWDLIYPFKRDQEINKKEVFALREEIKHINEKQQNLLNELEHANRILFDKDEDYKRHGLNYENARRGLEIELEKAHEELKILREKTASFDDLHRDFKKIEQEKFLLEEKLGYYDKENMGNVFTSDRASFFRQQDDLKRKIELLESDKQYLTKENIQLLEKNKRLEDRIDKLESEIVESKNTQQEYLFQLLNQKSQNSTEYEAKINREINELKEKHTYQLEMTKSNLIDIYEKQIRFLKEEKEQYEIKADRIASQLKEQKHSYDQLLIENRTLQRSVEGDMAELRIQYRLKQEEHERLSSIYEETLANLKASKQETEMLKDKLNILKSEYYKIEVQGEKNSSTIAAQLAVAKEQLRDYESIEKDIDQAIIGISETCQENIDPNTNVFLQTIQNAPTSTRRRIQQALSLAQKLVAKQKDYENLQQELRQVQERYEQLENELKLAKDLLDKSTQPSGYLIQTIQNKDNEILKYNELLKKTEKNLENIRFEAQDLKQVQFIYQLHYIFVKMNQKYEQDIKRLLVKREHINNIQTLLLSLTNSENQNTQAQAQKVLQDIKETFQQSSGFKNQSGQQFLINPNENQLNFFPQSTVKQTDQPQQIMKSVNIIQSGSQGMPNWYQSLKQTLKKK